MNKTFKFKVTIEKEIEVEIIESKFTPEFMKESEEDMYGFTTLKEHAKHIAQFRARFGDNQGMDGYYGMEDAYLVSETEEYVEIDEI